jgi:hypothetical protein
VRKVDIAHSGQTVSDAMEQLVGEIKNAYRGGERLLLIVHGFGASGEGGAIKANLAIEMPRLERTYRFKAYSDKDRLPRQNDRDLPHLNPGSTLLIFSRVELDRKSKPDFRPNFRNLRSKVKVRVGTSAPGRDAEQCLHPKRQLVSRGPTGNNYRCRLCGRTFLVPSSSA